MKLLFALVITIFVSCKTQAPNDTSSNYQEASMPPKKDTIERVPYEPGENSVSKGVIRLVGLIIQKSDATASVEIVEVRAKGPTTVTEIPRDKKINVSYTAKMDLTENSMYLMDVSLNPEDGSKGRIVNVLKEIAKE